MNAPWFHPMWSFLPGTLLGCIAGMFGGLVGYLLPRGKGRTFVLCSYWVLMAVSVGLLIAGIAAYSVNQPYAIWYGLGLAGLIGVIVLGANGPMIFRGYRQAEQRRMQAQDMA